MIEVLDKNWFARLLSERAKQEVDIVEVHATPLPSKGDGYLSDTARIRVKYQLMSERAAGDKPSSTTDRPTEELQLFAKFLPSDEGQRAFALKYNIYEREAIAYNDVFPGLQQLTDSENANSSFQIWPTCYFADKNMIVLEDLGHSGFKMGNRMTGLSLPDIQCSAKILARFHATSYAMFKRPGLSSEEFKAQFGVVGGDDLVDHASMRAVYANQNVGMKMVEAVKQHACANDLLSAEEASDLIPRLEKYVEQDLPDKVLEALAVESDMNCFVHGDCWVNNIFLKYEESDDGMMKAVDARLLDFQLVRFGQPSSDLIYLIYFSADRHAYAHQEEILKTYHKEFVRVATLILQPTFDEETYSWETFLNEYVECEKKGGLLLTIGMLPWVMASKDGSSENVEAAECDGPDTDSVGDDFVKLMVKSLNGPAKKDILLRFIDYCRRALELGVI